MQLGIATFILCSTLLGAARAESSRLAEDLFRTNPDAVSVKAKLFLVAGNSQAASFAQEVVDQRKLWLASGFHEDEIECYYVVPLDEDLKHDRRRFLALAPELSKCHISSVKRLRADLTAAAQGKPDFLYLYLTSHGDRPVAETLREASPRDRDYGDLKHMAKFPVFEKYQLLVEGMPDGTATSPELIGALRGGMDSDDLFLTPSSLRKSLSSWGSIPKYVVLQGCFSGGFFDEGAATPENEKLSTLSHITLLSASRHDRSSFGCEPGVRATYFGSVFHNLLAKRAASPLSIDWPQLFKEVRWQIVALEKRRHATPPSEPQFFTNSVK